MADDSTDQRFRDLEDHIRNTLNLLKQYEDKLRLADDPKESKKWETEITRLRSLLEGYQRELGDLHSGEAKKKNGGSAPFYKPARREFMNPKKRAIRVIQEQSSVTQDIGNREGVYPSRSLKPNVRKTQVEDVREVIEEIGRYLIGKFDLKEQDPLLVSYQWLSTGFSQFEKLNKFISELIKSFTMQMNTDEVESLMEISATLTRLSQLTSGLLTVFVVGSSNLSIPLDTIFPDNQTRRAIELATNISEQYREIADNISWGQTIEQNVFQIEVNLQLLQQLLIDIYKWYKDLIYFIESLPK